MADRGIDQFTDPTLWQEVEERLGCPHQPARAEWPAPAALDVTGEASSPRGEPPHLDPRALDELRERVGG